MSPAYDLRISNTVHTASYSRLFDLSALAWVCYGRLGPEIFPAVTFRIYKPYTTVSTFQTSKVVITGSNRSDKALLACYIISREIHKKLGIYTSVNNFRLENVVGSLALGYALNIDLFYADYNKKLQVEVYKRDVFPGLQIWPSPKSKIVFILFASGAVVISGAKSEEQFYATYEQMKDVFPKYRLGHEHRQMTDDDILTIKTRNLKKRKK